VSHGLSSLIIVIYSTVWVAN